MTPKTITTNTLFYGDNLPILREHIADESIDLIYLDPPFNSNRSYNVLFKDEHGDEAEAQMTAFEDTWHWNSATERTYHELIQNSPARVAVMLGALREFIGANQMMAYLVMMAARLVELHRVLKPTGSLYLHCDPTASHYLKILLDTIFGPQNFRNEITWKRSSAHNDPTSRFGRISDILLFYSKTENNAFNKQYMPYSKEYLSSEWKELPSGRFYKAENMLDPQNRMQEYDFMGTKARWRTIPEKMMELWNAPQTEVPNSHGKIKLGENGKPIKRCRIIFLDDMLGVPLQDLWDDISYIAGGASESMGYPTQKPLALLERIIQASSNEGDLVLDPFCGCGTAVAAAHKLDRRWIGIDITHLSISLMKYRLKDMFGLVEKKDYTVVGEPEDLGSARQLARSDRYQFQWWALSLLGAKPLGGDGGREGKKGSDKGVDGLVNFIDDPKKGKLQRVLIQVKSGGVKSGDVRDLHGTVDREEAAIGVFVTLEEPTRDMLTEAATAGFYHSPVWNKDYPRLQILTIEALLAGKEIEMPPSAYGTFKQAEKVKKEDGKQGELGI
jgi:site-specific DNA-methyltransferase (adenine-specific)